MSPFFTSHFSFYYDERYPGPHRSTTPVSYCNNNDMIIVNITYLKVGYHYYVIHLMI